MKGKRYEIVTFPSFHRDLQEIVDYITYHLGNPIAADNLAIEVGKAIEERRYFPEAYERYSSRRKRKHPYYRIQVKNFTVFYTVRGNTIEVRRIIHGSRDIQSYI